MAKDKYYSDYGSEIKATAKFCEELCAVGFQ